MLSQLSSFIVLPVIYLTRGIDFTTVTEEGRLNLFWLRVFFGASTAVVFGLAAVLYIIEDFNVGPQSDLAMYEKVVGIFPSQVWMYLWLGLAGLLFWWNLRAIFKKR